MSTPIAGARLLEGKQDTPTVGDAMVPPARRRSFLLPPRPPASTLKRPWWVAFSRAAAIPNAVQGASRTVTAGRRAPSLGGGCCRGMEVAGHPTPPGAGRRVRLGRDTDLPAWLSPPTAEGDVWGD